MFKDPEYDDNIFTVEALVAEGQFIIVQCFLDFGLFREPVRTKFDLIYGSRNRVTVVE